MTPNPTQAFLAAAENAHAQWSQCPASPIAPRDRQIFELAAVEHQTHTQIAKRFHISRSRVTQIITRVRQSLASAAHGPAPSSAAPPADENLHRLRLEHVLKVTSRALQKQPRSLQTSRQGDRDSEGQKQTWNETTRRQQPFNVQIVKAYLRAAEGLSHLDERQQAQDAKRTTISSEQLFQTMQSALDAWLREVITQPDIPSNEFIAIVEHFRTNLYRWLYHRRQGLLASEIASQLLPLGPSDDDQSTPTRSVSEGQADEQPANHANQTSPAPNHPLTAEAADTVAATSDPEPPSHDDPCPADPLNTPQPSPQKNQQVSRNQSTSTSSLNPQPRTPNPPPRPAYSDLLARRLAHDRKLEQLKEFRRRGLPCLFEFDPADGPLPNIHSPTQYAITEPGIY